MGKLERVISWISVVIALIALIITLHNFVEIKRNIRIIETQNHLRELFDSKSALVIPKIKVE
ncbi:hypothetical protein ES705_34146 [subsurface metagenome]|nr:MAG: hypothetical protein ES695_21825 [Candidatus Atribacteria bacterium 1244-E10-H5-B2]